MKGECTVARGSGRLRGKPRSPFILHPSSFILLPSSFRLHPSSFILRGFTLVELMIVMVIIVLLVSIAAPAVGPLMASNHVAEAAAKFSGALAMGQTLAEANVTPVAVRVERAYEINAAGHMVDADGRSTLDTGFQGPVWLPYQQIRYLLYASPRPGGGRIAADDIAFQQLENSKATKLPKGAWLAPDYSVDSTVFPSFASSDLICDPGNAVPPVRAAPFNRLDTFYVVFNRDGGLARFGPGGTAAIWYIDKTQPIPPASPDAPITYPFVEHPDNSARGVLVYDHKEFEQHSYEARRDYLMREARAVFVNRFIGSAVETEPR